MSKSTGRRNKRSHTRATGTYGTANRQPHTGKRGNIDYALYREEGNILPLIQKYGTTRMAYEHIPVSKVTPSRLYPLIDIGSMHTPTQKSLNVKSPKNW